MKRDEEGYSWVDADVINNKYAVMAFNIRPVRAWTGTVYIRADGSIDPPDAPITTSDSVTYTLTDDIAIPEYSHKVIV